MAKGGKIRKQDIFADDVLKSFQDLKTSTDQTVKSFKELVAEAKKIQSAMKGAKGIKDVSNESKKAADNTKKLSAEQKKLESASKRLAFELSDQGKEMAKTNEEIKRARKANRDYAQSQMAATKSTNTWGKALGSFAAKFNTIGNIAANVASNISRTFKRAVSGAVNIIIDFEQAMADVRSVSGSTNEQFEKLRNSARELGGSTAFTAAQVAGLQKEYAKLGFTADQILELQSSTLDLAFATGGDLAEAAKLVGGAMRAYNLEMKDASRVSSVLAVATTKSALTLQDYEVTLSTLAPVARTYGFTLEDTVALMGQLRNANFDTSKAATATRNILLNLADANGTLAQELGGNVNTLEGLVDGLARLRERGVDLNKTLELTDKRSVAAFNTFINGAEDVVVLRDALIDVNDELEEMVDIQMDTLQNKIKILRSAYEELVLEMSESEEVMSGAKGVIDTTTDAVVVITDRLDKSSGKWSKVSGKILRHIPVFGKVLKQYDLASGLIGRKSEKIKEEIDLVARLTKEEDAYNKMMDEGISRTRKAAEAAEAAEAERAAAAAKKIAEAEKKRRKATEEANKAGIEAIKKLNDETEKYLDSITELFIKEDSLSQKRKTGEKKDADEGFKRLKENLEKRRLLNLDKMKAENDEEDKNRKDQDEKEKQVEQEKHELKKELANEAFNFISAINDRQLEKVQAQQRSELEAIEAKYAAGSISTQQYEQGKVEIEKKYQEESLKLRRREARIDKLQALFNIGINTAVAISKALKTPLLIPFIAALGLAQAAAVIASPIPQFGEGGDIEGPSHDNGGVTINAEGGEYMVKKQQVKKHRSLIEAINNDTIGKEMLKWPGIEGGSQPEGFEILAKKMDELIKKPVDRTIIRPGGIEYIRMTRNDTIRRVESFRR